MTVPQPSESSEKASRLTRLQCRTVAGRLGWDGLAAPAGGHSGSPSADRRSSMSGSSTLPLAPLVAGGPLAERVVCLVWLDSGVSAVWAAPAVRPLRAGSVSPWAGVRGWPWGTLLQEKGDGRPPPWWPAPWDATKGVPSAAYSSEINPFDQDENDLTAQQWPDPRSYAMLQGCGETPRLGSIEPQKIQTRPAFELGLINHPRKVPGKVGPLSRFHVSMWGIPQAGLVKLAKYCPTRVPILIYRQFLITV